MKCPTENCPEVLLVHSRRKYCAKCRHAMAYHAKKRPAEILDYSRRLSKYLFRVEHIAERKVDQMEAVSVARRTKRAKSKAVRGNGQRVQL